MLSEKGATWVPISVWRGIEHNHSKKMGALHRYLVHPVGVALQPSHPLACTESAGLRVGKLLVRGSMPFSLSQLGAPFLAGHPRPSREEQPRVASARALSCASASRAFIRAARVGPSKGVDSLGNPFA